MVGDQRGLMLPDLSRYRTGISRLRGLRLIHTHLKGEPLNQEDLTDLALLRLDLVAVLPVDGWPSPGLIQIGHLLPENPEKKAWVVEPPLQIGGLDIDFLKWIQSLEDEFQKKQRSVDLGQFKEKAILLSVSRENRERLENSISELKELAHTSGIFVVDTLIQRPHELSPSTLIGEGKLRELLIKCMQWGVDLIIFDQNLTPGQLSTISDRTDLRVIDRTQLILDIFAQRAHTREGRVQVELAQLKYLLPRLAKKTLALSRLTGGIGGRGPGETKLEIDRRRVRDRIHSLEKELERLSRQREQRRARRRRTSIPVISIIGYTNAGKSTLFNLLTESHFLVEDTLFSTLDTATRRLRFPSSLQTNPRIHEVLVTDTVGLIKDLPKDLMGAFRPTFDELRDSHLLVHLIDISNPSFPEHIEAVEKVLGELGLNHLPVLKIFNKEDRVSPREAEIICQKYEGVTISCLRPETLEKFFMALEKKLDPMVRLTKSHSFDISNINYEGNEGRPWTFT